MVQLSETKVRAWACGGTVARWRKSSAPQKCALEGKWKQVTVYDSTGHFQKNDLNAYSLNSITAKKSDDGSVDVQFGGCDGKIPNCLPVMSGWNYMVRLYRPRSEVISGSWTFPEAEPAS